MECRVHVLGSCGGWPEPGRACSGFVVEHRGFRVVLDLGYGTLSPLLELLGSRSGEGVDAVVATHAHPDHVVDLHGFFRARWYTQASPRIPLYAPRPVLERMAQLEGVATDIVEQVFAWHELPGGPYRVGPFTLSTVELPHMLTNAGVRLESPHHCIAYTGDTGSDPGIARLGEGADLFIVDATDRQQRSGADASDDTRYNLTAALAGRAAAEAGAEHLLLTHFWPGNDRQRSRADAAAHFPGEISLAEEGLVLRL